MYNESVNRCAWCLCHPLAVEYHDKEWGTPVYDEQKHFEFITLEVMQAGLNWLMILKKRKNLQEAFDNFDYNIIAGYNEEKIEKLLSDPGIIRSRKKIEAVINNARMYIKLQKEFGSFSNYIWSFVDNKPILDRRHSMGYIPVTTELSDRLSKDLKKRGFKFLGSTTVYAHLQAAGLVNDHLADCFRYKELTGNL
ncbi:MAG: DNA-3-methyladenine glycosylase I [Clostridia bacterium]|nr:DNA-3-methyladenine glycosylase I [Clostridia bacterium]